MKTKWDLIDEAERASLEAIVFKHEMRCSGCGIRLVTEGDFARHYVIPNHRFKNLGECPNEALKNPAVLNRPIYGGVS